MPRAWDHLEVSVSIADLALGVNGDALAELPRPESEQSPATRVWNVPARHRGFTGRRELLAKLCGPVRTFLPTMVQALCGMGGIGRTAPGD